MGTLAVLLWFQLKNKSAKITTAIIGAILVVFIGISRMILAVHYFSDVIAGYCVSGAIVCFVILIYLNRHAYRTKKKCIKKKSAA
ncbi:phosphatase PAP2 family protein [Terrilactibacillus sp. S3-3]|nr:phosphatase PAP2 family protein [Terrilactibacillus sp. S3-3]